MRDFGHRADGPQRRNPIPNWLFYTVTLAVVGLWGAGIVISFVSKTFEMPASLNAALPVVLVGLYGTKAASDHRSDDDDD